MNWFKKKNINLYGTNKQSKFSGLSREELGNLCNILKLDSVRMILKKFPRLCSELLPGYRAEKISDEKLVSAIICNIHKNIVADFLDELVNQELSKINDTASQLEKEGYSHGGALIHVLKNSDFNDNLRLYFKISDCNFSEELIDFFCDAVAYSNRITAEKSIDDNAKQEKISECPALISNVDAEISTLKSTINKYKENEKKLLNDLEEQKKIYNDQKLQLENNYLVLKDSYDEIQEKYKDAYEKNKVFEKKYNIVEEKLTHYKYLEKYADTGRDNINDNRFQHISIGKVESNNSNWPVRRLADIENNEIIPFILNRNIPAFYDNREMIFLKNSHLKEGSIAVWNWKSVPNDKDPVKDVCLAEYNKYLFFTQIVELRQCHSLDDVSKELKNGIIKNFVSDKVLFVAAVEDEKIEGILCRQGDYENYGQMVKLSKSVVVLPVYYLKTEDIVDIDDIRVFRKINLGIPSSIHYVITPYEQIKNILLSRTSYLKEGGVSKNEILKYKNFLKIVPTKNIVDEISEMYKCPEDKANEYLNGFIDNIGAYLDSSDFEGQMLSVALERNSKLVERCKEQISREWENENIEKINKNKEILNRIERDFDRKTNEVNNLINQKKQLDSQIDNCRKTIAEQEKLADDVEKKIAERIENAKQNVAEFISQMSFITTGTTGVAVSNDIYKKLNVYKSFTQTVDHGVINEIETLEEELTDNLVGIGYEDQIATEMAFAISFGICNHIPIIVHENSSEIGRCTAATFNGNCLYEEFVPIEGASVEQLLESITNFEINQPKVFLIHGVFDGYNLNIFNALVSRLRIMEKPIIVFLSIEGLSAKMLPSDVWNRAFYIEGDEGLNNLPQRIIHSFNVSVEYKYPVDITLFKKKKNELKKFSKIIGLMQMNLYAQYLTCFNAELNDCCFILKQLIANAVSSDNEETLKSLFHENGISRGEEFLSKLL